ncbi:oxidoreductase-like protein [Amniculicola lignicola CBS 123094]|uniref:Oxidoreductase-like protein n=1 Tax=Amniculicola lignicola CBS 123094 TaxID=1392246 RepID=A0A6A5WEY4_9PLEO|nr:oxidoreductase-like protein [Amniculicola lignicola CBS 123094]
MEQSEGQTAPDLGHPRLAFGKVLSALDRFLERHFSFLFVFINVVIPYLQEFYQDMGAGKNFNPIRDIPSLKGKVILVTGGNAGLGKQTIAFLAQHQPQRIYLAARTASKAQSALADIKKDVPDAPVELLSLDLASFASIKSAAASFLAREQRLDLLINNAGVMALPYALTKEGYEIQFGTNHVGHALLTKLLLPTMLKTASEEGSDVRIVNVTSMGHRMAPSGGIIFDQKALEPLSTWRRYGQSKLANILFTRELATRYPQITSVAIHPGVIITDLYAELRTNWFMTLMVNIYRAISPILPGHFRDATGGALNQTWAATTDKQDVKNGDFYNPVGSHSSGSAASRDMGLAKKLWEWTEGEFGKHGIN